MRSGGEDGGRGQGRSTTREEVQVGRQGETTRTTFMLLLLLLGRQAAKHLASFRRRREGSSRGESSVRVRVGAHSTVADVWSPRGELVPSVGGGAGRGAARFRFRIGGVGRGGRVVVRGLILRWQGAVYVQQGRGGQRNAPRTRGKRRALSSQHEEVAVYEGYPRRLIANLCPQLLML